MRTYSINCTGCGRICEVVNPRLNEEPIRVSMATLMDSGRGEEVGMSCPHCRCVMIVRLDYPSTNEDSPVSGAIADRPWLG